LIPDRLFSDSPGQVLQADSDGKLKKGRIDRLGKAIRFVRGAWLDI